MGVRVALCFSVICYPAIVLRTVSNTSSKLEVRPSGKGSGIHDNSNERDVCEKDVY